mgnify:CR=1 FL=1
MEAIAAAHPHGQRLARVLEWAGLVWALVFTAAAGLFSAGYAMDDPGGWAGFGLVLTILLPMLALAGLVLWLPGFAVRVLVVLLAISAAVAIWQGLDPLAVRDFENSYGPVSAIGSFMTLPALGLLGARRGRPLAAGLIVLGIAGASLLGELMASPFHLGSSAAVALPMLLDGALFTAAGLLRRLG